MATQLDASVCIAASVTDLGTRDACILGQIGRLLKNSLANADTGTATDLFAPADQIDTTVALSPSPTWTYAGANTVACSSATSPWLGVRCGQVSGTGAFRVTSVDLQSVGLRGFKPFSGTIPTLFALLTALTFLNLANNKLSGSLPVFATAPTTDNIPTAFRGAAILAVPTSLTVFNVTGNRLGLTVNAAAGTTAAVATPLSTAVITNLVAMRSGGTYQLATVDLSSNCLEGTVPSEISQITIGESATVFRAFNLSGNAGIDGSKPFCGNTSSRPTICDGGFNNKFACQDNYFVDFGGQVTLPAGATSTDSNERATLRFTGPLAVGDTITVRGLIFTANTGGATAAQIAAAFANIKQGQTVAQINTQNGLSTSTGGGSFTADGTFTAEYTTGQVISPNTVIATAIASGAVTAANQISPTGAGGLPVTVTTIQGKAATPESAVVTFGALTASQSVTVDGLTLTAIAPIAAADVAKAFGGVAGLVKQQSVAGYKDGQFTGKLNNFKTSVATGNVVTFTNSRETGNVDNIVIAGTGAAAAATGTVEGKDGKTSVYTITFADAATGNALTLAGLTFTVTKTATTTAAELAQAFSNIGVGSEAADINTRKGLTASTTTIGTFTAGPMAGWSSGPANGAVVTFTSTTISAAGTPLASTGNPTTTAAAVITGEVAAQEVNPLTFVDVPIGGSLTVAGRTFTAKAAGTGVVAVPANTIQGFFAKLTAGDTFQGANSKNDLTVKADGSYAGVGLFTAGTLTGFSPTTGTAPTLTFTATAVGIDVSPDIIPTAITTGATAVVTQGAPAVSESSAVKFTNDLPPNAILTIAGTKFTAGTAGATAGQVAAAFAGLTAGATCTSPTQNTIGACATASTGFISGTASADNTVVFVPSASNTLTNGGVTDIVVTADKFAPVVTTIASGAKATAGSETITFGSVQAGQSVTIAGLSFRPNAAADAATLAAAFANLNAGATTGASTSLGTYGGTLTNFGTGAVTGGNAVKVTGTLSGNLPQAVVTTDSSTTTSATIAAAQAKAAVVETYTTQFTAGLAAAGTVTVGGLTLTVDAALTKEEVAAAFANLKPAPSAELANPARGAFSGSLNAGGTIAGFCSGPVNAAGDTVTFTTCVSNVNVDDITGPGTPAIKQGGSGKTETASVKFSQVPAGLSFTLAGLTYRANGASPATDVAAAFAALGYGTTAAQANARNAALATPITTGSFIQGVMTGWSTGAATGTPLDTVKFTSRTIAADVTNLAQTEGSSYTTIVPTDGSPVTSATNNADPETGVVTFSDLGQNAGAVVGGLTFTNKGTGTILAADVAAAFANLVSGSTVGPGVNKGTETRGGSYTGTLTGFTSSAASGTTVTFTASASGRNPTDLTVTGAIVTLTKVGNVDGAVAFQERATVTFGALAAGDSVTVAGLSFKAGKAVVAATLAKAFSNLVDGTTAATANGRTIAGLTFGAANTDDGLFSGTLTGFTSDVPTGAAVPFVATGVAPGVAVTDLVPFGAVAAGTAAVGATSSGFAPGTDGSYPYALVCGGNNFYVNYYMYEACILNNIRRALDPGVGTPAVQNNTALLTWMGDRACPSKNAVPWTGVSCDSNDRVTGISLSGQRITGTLPLDFFFLANLRTLDLSNNRIGGTFPSGTYQKWANARGAATATTISLIPTVLETLNIANNRISGGIDATAATAIISGTRRNINLSNNCLRGPLPSSLTAVATGAVLNLNGNRGRTGTADEALCPAGTTASILAVCNNRFTNELACSDFAGAIACDGVSFDNFQGYEACLLKRIGTALGANLVSLGWTGTVACPPPATPWTGITCDSQLTDGTAVRDRVVSINLSGRGLTGSLPFDIYYLSALQELNLANNAIKGSLPTQSVVVNGVATTAFPFPPSIRRVFLQNNALTGTINAALPAFLDSGKLANGTLQLTDLNLSNNCFTGPLASTFDVFIPRVTRVSFNGNQGLCTGIAFATTLAVCDSSTANAAVCAGATPGGNPVTTPVPSFSVTFQARFAIPPSSFNDPSFVLRFRTVVAGSMGVAVNRVRPRAIYLFETLINAIIGLFTTFDISVSSGSKKASTQEVQSVVEFVLFADNAAAATAAINNLIANPPTGEFALVPGSVSQAAVTLPPTAPVAPRVPAAGVTPSAPFAPFAPSTPAKGGDDDGWKIGVGVGVGVGGFLLCVIIICIVVFCLTKKAKPLPQEIDYNKVAVVQQGVPGAYPVYPQAAYPVYPQGAYAVSAPPPTPAYTYAVAA